MRIVAIRHLPTRYNVEGWLQGRRDEPILQPSPDVVEQIERNRERLHRESFDKVLVSRLQRTAMTAYHYGYDKEKEVEPLLDELDFGPFEGKPRAEMLQTIGEQWFERPHELTLGESLANLGQRVQGLLWQYRGFDSVLIFGHGAWIRALVAMVETGGIEGMNRFQIANNELCELQWR